jgi:hypothetical protein
VPAYAGSSKHIKDLKDVQNGHPADTCITHLCWELEEILEEPHGPERTKPLLARVHELARIPRRALKTRQSREGMVAGILLRFDEAAGIVSWEVHCKSWFALHVSTFTPKIFHGI